MKFDHLGYLVADLARAAWRIGRGGFPLTDRVRLLGPDDNWSGGEQQVAGLPDGYLEVQELVERDRGHVLASRADASPCAAVLAWMSDDLDADLAHYGSAGLAMSAAAGWSRTTDRGVARFRFASVLDPAGPLRVLVQHLDPDLTRRPIPTPNGVTRVLGVRRVGATDVQLLDAPDPESAVSLLHDARPIASVVLECDGPTALDHLAGSGWERRGSVFRSSLDLGADLELRWD